MPQCAPSKQDVYLQIFFAELDATGRLDTLGDCRLEQVRKGTPTWLPDRTTKVASSLALDITRSLRLPAGASARARHVYSGNSEVGRPGREG